MAACPQQCIPAYLLLACSATAAAGVVFDQDRGSIKVPLDLALCSRQQAALQTSQRVARNNQPSYSAVLVPADGRQGMSSGPPANSAGISLLLPGLTV